MDGQRGNSHATGWEISHQLFVWSPKGFLTGSDRTPGSLLVGWTFERADGYCEGEADAGGSCDNSNEFQGNYLTLRQLSAFYFLLNRVSAGVVWNWWKANKVTTSTSRDLGCQSKDASSARSCSWHNVMLVFRFEY